MAGGTKVSGIYKFTCVDKACFLSIESQITRLAEELQGIFDQIWLSCFRGGSTLCSGAAADTVGACWCLQVFTTCGSAAKRAFLRAAFPWLDDAHIGDSRSTSFEATVLEGVRHSTLNPPLWPAPGSGFVLNRV